MRKLFLLVCLTCLALCSCKKINIEKDLTGTWKTTSGYERQTCYSSIEQVSDKEIKISNFLCFDGDVNAKVSGNEIIIADSTLHLLLNCVGTLKGSTIEFRYYLLYSTLGEQITIYEKQ